MAQTVHGPSDLPDLSGLRVAVGLHLLRPTFREGYAEHAHDIVVRCLDIRMGLNESLPFLDQGADLVPCQVHAMEVCEATPALDLFDAQPDFLGGLVLIVVQIGKVHLGACAYPT